MQHADDQIILPWYRQFWPWFLMALPASAVVAGITTVFIATSNRDNLVVDNYYKQGLAINQTLTQQQQASAMKLQATVAWQNESGKLQVQLSGSQSVNDQVLKLTIAHATLAERDQFVILDRVAANQYTGTVKPLEFGKWHFILEPVSAQWRIEADVALPKQSWVLTPNV